MITLACSNRLSRNRYWFNQTVIDTIILNQLPENTLRDHLRVEELYLDNSSNQMKERQHGFYR